MRSGVVVEGRDRRRGGMGWEQDRYRGGLAGDER
jgi:hypothetical protein